MKAVIYARYSSSNQKEESIDGQLRVCKEFAEKNDIKIIGDSLTVLSAAPRIIVPNFKK